MVNNDKLLVIAKGMGLNNAYLRDSCDGRKLKPNQCEIIYIDSLNRFWTFNPNVHKDQVFEVLEWLLTKGHFHTLQKDWAWFVLGEEIPDEATNPKHWESIEDDFTENILEIAYLVASELINEE